MILATKSNGQKLLLRCGCTHSWETDSERHPDQYGNLCSGLDDGLCPKCDYFGWRPPSLTDIELLRPNTNRDGDPL